MSAEHHRPNPSQKPYEVFGLTEQEALSWRLSDEHFKEILDHSETFVLAIERSSNDFGEFLFITTGIWVLANDVGRFLSSVKPETLQPETVAWAVLLLFTAGALATTLNAWDLHPDHGPDRPAPDMAWFKLERLYARAADVVLAHAAEGETLCAGDIGMLGYRTGMHILDTVGLVTPESIRHYPADPDIYVINYAIPADLVLALDPDFIVVLEVYGRRGFLPDPRFQDRYRLLEKFEADIYGSDGMLVFARR